MHGGGSLLIRRETSFAIDSHGRGEYRPGAWRASRRFLRANKSAIECTCCRVRVEGVVSRMELGELSFLDGKVDKVTNLPVRS